MKRSFKKVTRIASGVVVSLATILLFQNCTGNGFASDGSDVLMEQDSSAHFASSSGDVKVGADEDIITPRLVFSSTPTGSAQKIFRPGQAIYVRAYGLGNIKENLRLHITPYNTGVVTPCLSGYSCNAGSEAYQKRVLSEMTYDSRNKTWNFQMKFAFDIARKVILSDLTVNALGMDGYCPPGTSLGSSHCTNLAQVENTVVVRSATPRIIATIEQYMDSQGDTYGYAPEVLDYKAWWKYGSGGRRIIVTGVPENASLIYCSEFAGTNACADKSRWVNGRKDPVPYVAEAQTFVIGRTVGDEKYYCGNYEITDPFNKTLNFYAEDLRSGMKAQGTLLYGVPIEGCKPSSTPATSGPSQGGFGP